MKKTLGSLSIVIALIFSFTVIAMAEENPTPEQAQEAVLDGVLIMAELGEEGLAAFNDPKSELHANGTFQVFVTDCGLGKIIAHPTKQYIGLSADLTKDYKSGRLILKEACENISPQGSWSIYWWPETPGSETLERRVAFAVPVPETKYQVFVTIRNFDATMDGLNELLK